MSKKSVSTQIQIILKRLLDITFSLLGLIVLSPVFALISFAIMLETPGGVIYRHKRVGFRGRPIKVYKFRSMVANSDDKQYLKYLETLIASEEEGRAQPYRKMNDDHRVTRVGKIIRCYFLDELPQIFNILKGEMSFVGPRPHVQLEVDHYSPEQKRRLSVKPGLTGLWQVEGKFSCTFNELIELDLQYIDHWTLKLDSWILWRTFYLLILGGEKHILKPAQEAYAFHHPASTTLQIPTTGEQFFMEKVNRKESEVV